MKSVSVISCTAVFSLWISVSASMNIPCVWYPTLEYKDVAMQCSGHRVKHPPEMLPRSLDLLKLTGTDIHALEADTFQGRDLPDLSSLHVTQGDLTTVGPEALCSLPTLTQLDLSDNRLKLLYTSSFSCNKRLRSINLSGNPSLHHLPPLESSSIETMYVENCGLESIDVATVEGMTALKALYVGGNQALHCPSLKSLFRHARPDLLVVCNDSPAAHLPPLSADDQERLPQNSLKEAEVAASTTTNTNRTTARSNASGLSQGTRIIVPLAIFILLIIPFPS